MKRNEKNIRNRSRGLLLAVALFSWSGAAADEGPAGRANAHGPFERPAYAVDADSLAEARDAAKPYVLEADSSLLRDARPGETPMQTLDRERSQARATRILTGTGFVLTGPVLIAVGVSTTMFEAMTYSDRNQGAPWLLAGFASTGVGIALLASKWEAERKWERVVRDRLRMGLHPAGKGAMLAVSF